MAGGSLAERREAHQYVTARRELVSYAESHARLTASRLLTRALTTSNVGHMIPSPALTLRPFVVEAAVLVSESFPLPLHECGRSSPRKTGDSDSFVKLIADDFVSESDTLPTPLRGRDGARQSMQMYIKAFPDLRFDIEQMIASGEYVVTRWHATVTHKGELMGIPATGRRGDDIHGCTVAEYRDAKAVREWVYWDVATLLRQIGVMPALMRAV